VNQAAMNTAITVSRLGPSPVVTVPCADGGSMSMTFGSPTQPISSGTFTSSSRLEFTDCRTQTVTINGDPFIMMDGTYTFTTGTGNVPSSMTATTRMTGGLRFDAAGMPGRARYDCTMTTSMPIPANGSSTQPVLATITSSGTITWEQPLGTVSVRPCGG